jgi:hypothetical protein
MALIEYGVLMVLLELLPVIAMMRAFAQMFLSRDGWEMTLPLLHFQTAPSVLTLKILMGHPNRFIPLLVMMQDARVWELERQQLPI